MSRLLLIAAVIAVIYLLLKSFRNKPAVPDEKKNAEDMVQCAYCGIHSPRSESLEQEGKHYCSAAHRDVQR
jgi:uncharacterized protein